MQANTQLQNQNQKKIAITPFSQVYVNSIVSIMTTTLVSGLELMFIGEKVHHDLYYQPRVLIYDITSSHCFCIGKDIFYNDDYLYICFIA